MILTLEPEGGSESPDLLALPIIQDEHLHVGVVQFRHVGPRVGQEVQRLLANRKKHVHRGMVALLVRFATDLGVLVETEVLTPHGYTQVCACACVLYVYTRNIV